MAIIENKYKVSVSNVGASNMITNKGILSLLEDLGCIHSDIAGYGLNDIPVTHLSWVLLNWKVQVLKRAKYGSDVTVRTWAKCSNKFYTYRDFEILDESGTCVCKATSKWALISTDTGRLAKITDDIIEKYQPEVKNVFEEPEIDKLIEPALFLEEYTYTVQRSDIDFNKHMHNLNYLSLAYEVLPENVYYSTECNNIEIMYKKGIKLGETVKCLYSYVDGAHIVTIKSKNENTLYSIVKLY